MAAVVRRRAETPPARTTPPAFAPSRARDRRRRQWAAGAEVQDGTPQGTLPSTPLACAADRNPTAAAA